MLSREAASVINMGIYGISKLSILSGILFLILQSKFRLDSYYFSSANCFEVSYSNLYPFFVLQSQANVLLTFQDCCYTAKQTIDFSSFSNQYYMDNKTSTPPSRYYQTLCFAGAPYSEVILFFFCIPICSF